MFVNVLKKYPWTNSYILVYFLICIITIITFGKHELHHYITWDVSGYHLYSPAIFIYRDLKNLEFYNLIDIMYAPTGVPIRYSIADQPEGYSVLKYPAGVSIIQLPFFFLSYLFCKINPVYPNTGYSIPYQLGVAFSTVFYTTLGLYVLSKLLLKKFSDFTTFLTLLITSLGTNLAFYTALSPGFSHNYLFCINAILMLLCSQNYESASIKRFAFMGFLVGLSILSRPLEGLILLFVFFYGISNLSELGKRISFFLTNIKKTLVFIFSILAVVSVQFCYWKYVTGNWLYYSYGDEKFIFNDWHLIDGLFSYKKGWLVYSPLVLFSFLGIIILYNKQREYFIPLLIYLLFSLYFTFTWWKWYYSGSFGARSMIHSLALLSVPLAYFIQFVINKKILKPVFIILVIIGISLSVFQTIQYQFGIIHYEYMDKKSYWYVFGKLTLTPEEYEELYTP